MNYRQANSLCRDLCRKRGIRNPPQVTRLQFQNSNDRESFKERGDKTVALGHWDRLHRCLEVNIITMQCWSDKQITETIQHELVHTRCYEKYPDYCGDHDQRFLDTAKEMGVSDYVAKARKD